MFHFIHTAFFKLRSKIDKETTLLSLWRVASFPLVIIHKSSRLNDNARISIILSNSKPLVIIHKSSRLNDNARISIILSNSKFCNYFLHFPDFIIASPKSEIQPVIGIDEVGYSSLLLGNAEGSFYNVVILRACNLNSNYRLGYP